MIRRIAGWFSSLALGMLVVGPLAALGACALIDLGPGGEARASLFPLAVTALDPFVWTSLRNTVAVAGAASLATIVGGVIAGRVVGEPGGASRAAALTALRLAAASPPFLLALGASAILDSGGAATWSRWLVSLGSWARRLPSDPGWIAWLLAAAIPGAAAGGLSYLRALDGLAPPWREAATLAGGSRAGRWRRLAWPLLRPALGRAGALTFAVTLADPGPALILGLRRTLGTQMVLAAIGEDPFPRLAVLGLVAILTASAWRAALRLWSGRERETTAEVRADRQRPAASWRRALARSTVAALLGGPVVVAMIGVGTGLRSIDGSGTRGASVGSLLADPLIGRILVRSLMLGLSVAALAAVSDRVVRRMEASAGPGAAGRFRRLARASAPPPLAAGVVILALGRSIGLAGAAGWVEPSAGVEGVSAWLSGDRTPFVATTLAVWLAVASARIGRDPLHLADEDADRGNRFDAALLAGAGRRRARRLARGGTSSDGLRDFAATLATAAVNVAPAMLIASSAQFATLGPGVLLFRERPDAGATVAASLAMIAWAVALASSPIGGVGRRIASTTGAPRA